MQNIDYHMHIAKKNLAKDKEYADKIGGCIITNSAIESVPCARITQNNSLNLLIRRHHQSILELSRSRKDGHKYDEVGYLLELVEPYNNSKPIYGYYENDKISHIKVNKNEEYMNIVANTNANQLLFMHNHPNNSSLSYGDISNLIYTESLYGVTAVCNNGSLYVAYKTERYNYENMLKLFLKFENNIKDKENKDRLRRNMLTTLINNSNKYNIIFHYSKRRS